ncbi:MULTISPECIES: hypothetical protein [Kitasatospora]|uniref:Uncharacterized protein n=1 Tax=Kitasatospora setae (strain ATCC 33774 / DSM 43861 / JCM 3304 / KCC A-0304 / NBRC 14216 / KM-6054) TaxID=452652 RepID=E4N150_KITSK|nr:MULTISPECIES: hypothetical protein [Kitasatospora]BAJ31884.1 hypothetical protein KSE_61180 [Kitasatospora setae KM-6054]
MAWLLVVLLVAVVCGFVGVLVKGLLWLLVIGAVLFVGALLVAGVRMGRAGRSTPR